MARILEQDIMGFKLAYIIVRPGKHKPLKTVPIIIRLRIPKGAYVTNNYRYHLGVDGNKRRCSRAIVEEFIGINNFSISGNERHIFNYGKVKKKTAHSFYSGEFIYKLGKMVQPDGGVFELDDRVVCGEGIHFFDDAISAIDYIIQSGAMEQIGNMDYFFKELFYDPNHIRIGSYYSRMQEFYKTENFKEFKSQRIKEVYTDGSC